MSDTKTLRHIGGSTFGLSISTDTCPIVDPTGDPIDTTGWSIAMRFIGPGLRFEVPGKWLETTGPWSASFEERSTHPWVEGAYEVRVVYVEPFPGSRRFEVQTDMVMEVQR